MIQSYYLDFYIEKIFIMNFLKLLIMKKILFLSLLILITNFTFSQSNDTFTTTNGLSLYSGMTLKIKTGTNTNKTFKYISHNESHLLDIPKSAHKRTIDLMNDYLKNHSEYFVFIHKIIQCHENKELYCAVFSLGAGIYDIEIENAFNSNEIELLK